ncbi:GNAT family N-acetyltransferase [Pseudomonas guariconensis]|uniref:GNAT family N-acetyltransferase n=1 Tax=Pseudomonas guariconensis TaxID=1288410 RepID=UPI002B0626B3|nr:GNAT family N-acetyltransferase [Pseudomonas guariconensis]
MNPLHCSPLGSLERKLLDHFYRQHGSRMRAAGDGQWWVARAGGIVAGMSLSPVAEGRWLTGLFVAPQWRGQQVASQLIEAALQTACGPTWLFCHPELEAFYQRQAFTPTGTLPDALASRLARYQRSKCLVAMVRGQSSGASSPGNSTSV